MECEERMSRWWRISALTLPCCFAFDCSYFHITWSSIFVLHLQIDAVSIYGSPARHFRARCRFALNRDDAGKLHYYLWNGADNCPTILGVWLHLYVCAYCHLMPYTLSLTHTHMHTRTRTHTHTHNHTHSHTHTLSLSLTHTHTHTRALSLSHTHTNTHTHTHAADDYPAAALGIYQLMPHTHTHHTRARAHTHTISRRLPRGRAWDLPTYATATCLPLRMPSPHWWHPRGVTRLSPMRDMTFSYLWHDSFMWHVYLSDCPLLTDGIRAVSNLWHYSYLFVTLLLYIFGMSTCPTSLSSLMVFVRCQICAYRCDFLLCICVTSCCVFEWLIIVYLSALLLCTRVTYYCVFFWLTIVYVWLRIVYLCEILLCICVTYYCVFVWLTVVYLCALLMCIWVPYYCVFAWLTTVYLCDLLLCICVKSDCVFECLTIVYLCDLLLCICVTYYCVFVWLTIVYLCDLLLCICVTYFEYLCGFLCYFLW